MRIDLHGAGAAETIRTTKGGAGVIERRPATIIDFGFPDAWWCTDCNRVITSTEFEPKPTECPLWQCRERRQENAMTTPVPEQEPNMSLVESCPKCRGSGWVGTTCPICKGTLFVKKEADGLRNLVSCPADHEHRLFCPCTTRSNPDDPTSTETGRTLKILRERALWR